jgi:hypothetical protein
MRNIDTQDLKRTIEFDTVYKKLVTARFPEFNPAKVVHDIKR